MRNRGTCSGIGCIMYVPQLASRVREQALHLAYRELLAAILDRVAQVGIFVQADGVDELHLPLVQSHGYGIDAYSVDGRQHVIELSIEKILLSELLQFFLSLDTACYHCAVDIRQGGYAEQCVYHAARRHCPIELLT